MPRSELWPTKVQGVPLFLSKQEIKKQQIGKGCFRRAHRSCSVPLHQPLLPNQPAISLCPIHDRALGVVPPLVYRRLKTLLEALATAMLVVR